MIDYNRKQFVARIKHLAKTMLEDHEDHTGVTETERMTFREWIEEVCNAEDNA